MIGDPTELLMFLETRSTKIRLKMEAGGWNWRHGVEIFIAPDTRCSFCNEVFETNRIYLVDISNFKVPKQWRLADGKAVRKGNKMYHPHAFHADGGVCMNLARDMAQLLFNSINTGATYHAQNYFWDVGHTCSKFVKDSCPFCAKKVPRFALKYVYGNKILCSEECLEGAKGKHCFRCFALLKEMKLARNGVGPYCKKCLTLVNKMMEAEDSDDE